MRALSLALALTAVALVSADTTKVLEVPSTDIGERVVIYGRLARPVGEQVTIEGEKVHAGKGDEIAFFVSSVNGQVLEKRTTVDIDGIVDWPIGTKAKLRGHEIGTLMFYDARSTGVRNPEKFALIQTVYLCFEAAKVIGSKNLELKRNRPYHGLISD